MNPTSQIESHPGAESLNAFAEQALKAAERERILAHLAGCGRCRQVVFLARQAAADAEGAAQVVAMPSAQPAGGWFRGWRIAWIPASALAAALALLVVFHPRPAPLAPQVAQLAPQTESAASAAAAEAAKKGPQRGEKPGSQPAKAKTAAPRAALAGVAPQAASESALPPEPDAPLFAAHGVLPQPPSLGARGPGAQGGPVVFKPAPLADALTQNRQLLAGRLAAGVEAPQPAESAAQGAVASARASRPVTMNAAMARSAAPPPAGSGLEPMPQAGVPLSTGSLKLPSGLAAVSTATSAQRTLAIDLAGALFLSEDAGAHWKAVASQWSGRAIQVRSLRELRLYAAPGPRFELVSDNGSTWVSADGKLWTQR